MTHPGAARPCRAETVVVALLAGLTRPSGQADPYQIYQRLRQRGPVIAAPWGGVLVTGYAEARDVVADGLTWPVLDAAWRDVHQPGWRSNCAISGMVGSAVMSPPTVHRQVRRVMGPRFTPRVVEGLRQLVRNMVDRYLERLAEGMRREGSADFVAVVSDPLPLAVLCTMLGTSTDNVALWGRLAHRVTTAVELAPGTRELDVAHTAGRVMFEHLKALVEQRRVTPGPDLVSWMLGLAAAGSARLRYRQVVSNLGFMLSAGSETTGGMLSNIVLALCQHPEQAAWLRAHPEHIPAAVEEFMRWDPPVQMTFRTAATDVEIGGMPVRAGEVAHVLIGSANRDPVLIAESDRFDLRRDPVDHLGFSVGAHYCLGAALARLEAAELITGVLERFPGLRLAEPPTYRRHRVVIRNVDRLPVTWVR